MFRILLRHFTDVNFFLQPFESLMLFVTLETTFALFRGNHTHLVLGAMQIFGNWILHFVLPKFVVDVCIINTLKSLSIIFVSH